ncbi:YD repeat protein [Candidatus Moduliflexus flocculans]|uniref:YD repeat protein n=1 Tax=Candidatus Moduliflexus flocculans TaxID=1499966 RepID=A0A0S6VS21_9BACT|nr:YD repeat protein [Candidatus Moduliflexus flocculans]
MISILIESPFGTLLAKTGTFDQPFQFSTKRADARIGMVQYEFRNYLPAIGRWMTRDPLGEAGGLNLYAFVGNNPVDYDIYHEHYKKERSERSGASGLFCSQIQTK